MAILRYAKFAEEGELLEDPLPAPQFTVDIQSAGLDVPGDTMLTYEGGIGRGPRLQRPGFYAPSGDVAWGADPHTVGWALKWALGGYAYTADGGTAIGHNLHEFWGATDTVLPSFTCWLGKDIFEHVFRGLAAGQLALEVADGFANLTLETAGSRDEKGTLDTSPLASLPLPPPLTFADVRLWVGGQADADERSAAVRSLTWQVGNNVDSDAARGLGSRFPRRAIPAGQRDTTLEFTVWYDSTEHIERVWGDAAGPTEGGSVELPLHLEASVGDYGVLHIELPRCVFTSVTTQPSGRSPIEQSLSVQANLDTVALADASEVESEVLVRLENDRPEYAAAA